MEYHKGMMKTFLYENLRALMLRNLFDKITIKQICDETGVIRATFYNYFDDKYDCLNAIVYHDLAEEFMDSLSKEKFPTLLEKALANVEKNRDFYRMAYNVTGQNSFEDMIRKNLAIIFTEYFRLNRKPGYLDQYSNDVLARYYAECVAFDIKLFVFQKDVTLNAHQAEALAIDLMTHSFMDFTK